MMSPVQKVSSACRGGQDRQCQAKTLFIHINPSTFLPTPSWYDTGETKLIFESQISFFSFFPWGFFLILLKLAPLPECLDTHRAPCDSTNYLICWPNYFETPSFRKRFGSIRNRKQAWLCPKAPSPAYFKIHFLF